MKKGQAGSALCPPPSSGISSEQDMLMSLFSSIPDLLSLMFVEHTQSYSNPPAACDYLISADREFVHALTKQTREQQSVRRSLLHPACTVQGSAAAAGCVVQKHKDIQELLKPPLLVWSSQSHGSHAAPAKPDVSSQHPCHGAALPDPERPQGGTVTDGRLMAPCQECHTRTGVT